jgi:hypothetical protein
LDCAFLTLEQALETEVLEHGIAGSVVCCLSLFCPCSLFAHETHVASGEASAASLSKLREEVLKVRARFCV